MVADPPKLCSTHGSAALLRSRRGSRTWVAYRSWAYSCCTWCTVQIYLDIWGYMGLLNKTMDRPWMYWCLTSVYKFKDPYQLCNGFLCDLGDVLQQIDCCGRFLLSKLVSLGERWHTVMHLQRQVLKTCENSVENLSNICFGKSSITGPLSSPYPASSVRTDMSCDIPDLPRNSNWWRRLKALGRRRTRLPRVTPQKNQ